MSDRSGQNDTDNSFAGISFEGVNAVPPQSGENGDTINLADVADVSEQDDVSNAATETMPPLNFASDQTQPFQSFPTAGAAETTPAGTVPNGAVPTGAIPTGDMPSSTPAPAIPRAHHAGRRRSRRGQETQTAADHHRNRARRTGGRRDRRLLHRTLVLPRQGRAGRDLRRNQCGPDRPPTS